MQTERSPYPRMAAALLALLGLFDAAYLSLERLIGDTGGFCPTGGGCTTVQTSAYAVFLGVPVAYIGVAGYVVLLALALLSLSRDWLGSVHVTTLLLSFAGLGVLFSLYLVYLQVAVIGAICFWCMVSALIETGILVAALLDWHAMRAEEQTAPAQARHARAQR